MKHAHWASAFGWLIITGIIHPALSQTPTSTTAADLTISPRLGIQYTTSGGGFDGVTRFEGFVPLMQTPGSSVLFLEGRFLLDNDANIGGNLLLGYRMYNPANDRTFGDYIAYDNRETDQNTFSQLGLGIDSLGEIWDIRANAYFPIGDTRQQVSQRSFDRGTRISSLGFQGNYLAIAGQRQQQIVRQLEAAVGGFDIEAGVRLLRLGEGDLRAYGGLYYFDSAGDVGTLGWRLRLEARPTDGLIVGLAVQDDGLFGTNVIANVGLTLPGIRPRGAPSRSALARLGESPTRAATIIVDHQVESTLVSEPILAQVATNPATGQPYVFQHVGLGAASGNGTIEQPYGTVQPALDGTQSDGNSIVYVQAGTDPGIPGFAVPDRVQVLSTGPVQQLETVEFGVVQLPLSGTGVLPTVTNTVTLGNQSTLSGFAITGVTGPGIVATNVRDAVVRDSTIVSATNPAILLNNTTGTLSFTRTSITGTGTPAVVGSGVANLTIVDSRLTSTNSTTDGITLDGVSGTLTLTNTPIEISNSTGNGLLLQNVTGSVDLPAGVITNPGAAGVAIQNSPGTIAIRNFQITNSGDSGILADTVGTLTLQSNRIDTPTNQGIRVRGTSGPLTIADNTVTNTVGGTTEIDTPITLPGAGGSVTVPTPLGTITIPLPTGSIPLPSGQGIVVTNANGPIEVTRNAISGTATQGVVIVNGTGSVTLTENSIANTVGTPFSVPVTGGTIAVPTGQGVVVANTTGPLDLSRNTISNTNGQGIVVSTVPESVSVQANTVDRATDQGILVAGTTGAVTIANNTVTNTTGRTYTVPVPLLGTLELPTGQGIALGGVTGTVAITGNTVTGTTGFQPGGIVPPSGQGIGIANRSGQVTLTVSDNQIRTNFNDGVLLVLTGDATADLALVNNTIENNGNATAPDIRGDGIAIGLEQNALVNSLTISGNTIQNNGDEGIDIRTGLTFPATNIRLTGSIRNNTITSNGQNGIQVGVQGGSQVNLAIESNTITANGLRGIDLSTAGLVGTGTPQFSANVRGNTITTTGGNVDFQAQTAVSPGVSQTMCVDFSGNTLSRGIVFVNVVNAPTHSFSSVGTLFDVFFNRGNLFPPGTFGSFQGSFGNVAACP